MNTSLLAWFVVTLVVFGFFVGWVIHEILSVGKRVIAKQDPFDFKTEEDSL